MMYLKLFCVFFRIGLFAVGGAYSFLPLLEKELVEENKWLTKEEFLDILGITRISPGAISVKFATYIGYKFGGILGAFLCNLGNIIAPVLIVILITLFYTKFKNVERFKNSFNLIQLVVFAMIIVVALNTVNIKQILSIKGFGVVFFSFILFYFFKIHPAVLIIAAGLIGYFTKC